MFHVKCITCKNFDHTDGCKFDFDDENCSAYEEIELSQTDEEKPSCKNCEWFFMGHCDFDLTSPLTCRRFKNKKDEN